MIGILHVDKNNSPVHQEEGGKDNVQRRDEEFNTLLNQLMHSQSEERGVLIDAAVEPRQKMGREVKPNEVDSHTFQNGEAKEGLLRHTEIQEKRVSSKKAAGSNSKSKMNLSSYMRSFSKNGKAIHALKEMVYRGGREEKEKRASTRFLSDVHIPGKTKKNRKLFVTNYSVKRGRKLRQAVSTSGKKKQWTEPD